MTQFNQSSFNSLGDMEDNFPCVLTIKVFRRDDGYIVGWQFSKDCDLFSQEPICAAGSAAHSIVSFFAKMETDPYMLQDEFVKSGGQR